MKRSAWNLARAIVFYLHPDHMRWAHSWSHYLHCIRNSYLDMQDGLY